MEEEKKQKMEKAKKRMNIINRFRLVFMFVAIVLLVFIFWGGKVWEDAEWFINVRQKCYNFLWYDIVLLVITTFAKLFSAMRYNSTVRKL
ncbi:MAG: hypothetical protein HDQ96_15405 [Lachnospiraceae bacterium]|nr:hypothetical protein [Lachnospiraceae bacterium]